MSEPADPVVAQLRSENAKLRAALQRIVVITEVSSFFEVLFCSQERMSEVRQTVFHVLADIDNPESCP